MQPPTPANAPAPTRRTKKLLAAGAISTSLLLGLGGVVTTQIASAQDGTEVPQGHSSHEHSNTDHAAAMALVADELATHTAVSSGPWSDPATWGGVVPADGARVVIPNGMTVTVDAKLTSRIETVGVHGTLRFATDTNTELLVDTLVSSPTGTVEVGTAATPIQDNAVARIVFIDDGPIDRSVDPSQLGRGAVLHGNTVMHGAETTHRVTLAQQATAGASEITLTGALTGWGVGDQIVITGTQGPTSDEVRTIASIDGATVTFTEPLALDHVAPRDDLNVYVANTSRNIIVESESTDVERRGHVMFMHTHQVDVNNVRFDHLGRTDKSVELNDVSFGETAGEGGNEHDGTFELGEATNIRSRYSVHVHRGGTDPAGSAALIKGSVVFDDPGWGFVNHSSNVNFVDNVSYRVSGVGFMTEAGDEVGSMVGNIAIRSVMPGFTLDDLGAIDPDTRSDIQDFGFQGDGFWLQGNRVAVVDNVAAGSSAHGIIFWSEGLVELKGDGENRAAVNSQIDVSTLPNASLLGDREQLEVWWAPLADVKNNESYGATVGFRSRYVHGGTYLEDQNPPPQEYIDTLNPVIDGLVVWDVRDGVLLNYNERLSLRNADIIGNGDPFNHNLFSTAAVGVGVDLGNEITQGPGFIENVRISGFEMGLIAPRNGQWTVDNVELANLTDVLIHETREDSRALDLSNVRFVALDGSSVAGRDGERQNVVLDPWFVGAEDGRSFLISPDRITFDGERVFFDGQGLDKVPVTLARTDVEEAGECSALGGEEPVRRSRMALRDDEDFDDEAEFEDDGDEPEEDADDDQDDELDEFIGFVEDHFADGGTLADLDDEDREVLQEVLGDETDLDELGDLDEGDLEDLLFGNDVDDEDSDEGFDDEDAAEDSDDEDSDDEDSDEDFDGADSDDEDSEEGSDDEGSDDEDSDEGSDDEEASFDESGLVGCTNRQLIELLGSSFGGATTPEGAVTAPWLVGGVVSSNNG